MSDVMTTTHAEWNRPAKLEAVATVMHKIDAHRKIMLAIFNEYKWSADSMGMDLFKKNHWAQMHKDMQSSKRLILTIAKALNVDCSVRFSFPEFIEIEICTNRLFGEPSFIVSHESP